MPRRTVAICVSLDTRAEGRERSSGVRPLLLFARSRGRDAPWPRWAALVGLGRPGWAGSPWLGWVALVGLAALVGWPPWLGWVVLVGLGRPGWAGSPGPGRRSPNRTEAEKKAESDVGSPKVIRLRPAPLAGASLAWSWQGPWPISPRPCSPRPSSRRPCSAPRLPVQLVPMSLIAGADTYSQDAQYVSRRRALPLPSRHLGSTWTDQGSREPEDPYQGSWEREDSSEGTTRLRGESR